MLRQPLIAAAIAAAAGLLVLVLPYGGGAADPARRAFLGCALAFVVGVVAVAVSGGSWTEGGERSRPRRWLRAVRPILEGGLIAVGPALTALTLASPGRLAAGGAVLLVAIPFFSGLAAVRGSLRSLTGNPLVGAVASAGFGALLLLDLFVSIPLFALGDGAHATLSRAVLLANPLVALSLPAFGVDWLRQEIVYASSPISSYPFVYPGVAEHAAVSASVMLVLVLIHAVIVARRRPPEPRSA